MPTLDSADPERDALADPRSMLATHHDGREPFDERFRRASLRKQMFGEAEELTIGRYTVKDKIGAGAMGSVYLAEDASLEREVAIKILHRRDDANRKRMEIEAKALAKLSHPNVVTVHEVGAEDGQVFVAMEYVRGCTLTQWLERDGDAKLILDVFAQAAKGLHAAHEAGIVHRDFKPDNVLVGDDGRVRVVDFGLARASDQPLTAEVDDPEEHLQPTAPTLTRTGVLAGTPGYMAPEQFVGGGVDARADQFSYCIALHEAVWGSRPFAGETLAELSSAVQNGEAAPFGGQARPSMSRGTLANLRNIIARGISTDPRQRFESMHVVAERVSTAAGKPQRTRKQKLQLWALAVVAGIAGTASGGYVTGRILARFFKEPPPATAAFAPTRIETKCGFGTHLVGDTCQPIPFDPRLVRCGDGQCEVPRWMMKRFVDDADFRNNHGRFIPSRTKEGAHSGFKIYGARAGNFTGLLGFEPGDLATAVGHVDLATHPGKLSKEMFDLENVTEFEVSFRRKGVPMTQTIVLTEAPPPAGSR